MTLSESNNIGDNRSLRLLIYFIFLVTAAGVFFAEKFVFAVVDEFVAD